MEFTRIYLVCFLALLVSCNSSKQLKRSVIKNKSDFINIAVYIEKNKLLDSRDSIVYENGNVSYFKNKCVYSKSQNKQISDFMLNNNLYEICKYDGDKKIYFTADRPPYFPVSRVVYDGGNSNLRDSIVDYGLKGYSLINDNLIFVSNNTSK